MKREKGTIVVATDGSSLGNPGPAGWAWVCTDGRQDWASAKRATNNRMELMAVSELLASTTDDALTIYTDSQYVINIFTEWLPAWKRRGMRTGRGKPIENEDIILSIEGKLQSRSVLWEWVRGHSGHALNEAADTLARFAAERAKYFEEHGVLPNASHDPPRMSQRGPPARSAIPEH